MVKTEGMKIDMECVCAMWTELVVVWPQHVMLQHFMVIIPTFVRNQVELSHREQRHKNT